MGTDAHHVQASPYGARMIPRRRTRPRMMAPKEDAPISCPGHDKWVRGLVCCALGRVMINPLGKSGGVHECQGRMEAHHETTRGAGGGDDALIPLCLLAHAQHHNGCTFVGLDQPSTAADCWRASPHGQKYRRQQEQRGVSPAPCQAPTPTKET